MTILQATSVLVLLAAGLPSRAADVPGPKAVTTGFAIAAAAGDRDGVFRRIAVVDQQDEVLRPLLAEVVVAAARYEKAVRAAFGAAAAGQYGVAAKDEAAAWTTASVHGDTVTVDLADKPVLLKLVERDGRWAMPFAAVAAYFGAKGVDLTVPGDEPVRRWSDVAAAFGAAEKAVRDGQYATAAAASKATHQTVLDAARGANAN